MGDASAECGQRIEIFQVADMVADEGPAPAGEAKRVLLVAADGEQRHRAVERQGDRLRCVATGAAQQHGDASNNASHRVVAARLDGPIVGEDGVGDRRKADADVVVDEGDRLIAHVAAGEHQGHSSIGRAGGNVVQQQVVQWRVGQHQAERGNAGGYLGGDLCILASLQQHDRAARRNEQRGLGIADVTELPRGGKVGNHQGKRPCLAALAAAQGGHGCGGACVTGQMVAANTLHSDDKAGGVALCLDRHARLVIAHKAAQTQALRLGIHEGAKAHTLDDAGNGDPPALSGELGHNSQQWPRFTRRASAGVGEHSSTIVRPTLRRLRVNCE